VTTGPDLIGVRLGLILTRVRAPPEEQDEYWRTAADRGSRQAWPIRGTRRQQTAPATYIHTPPHTRTHTHTRVTCEIHAHARTAIVYYDSLQLTSSMHEANGKGQRSHGQKEIMHAYGPKSTPIAQGLVEDINAMHAYGRSSAPIAQGLLYYINVSHVFGLKESKRTYASVSTPIAQGLVAIINTKDQKMVMSPKAQGLVSNTHHVKKRMLKN